MPPGTCTHSPPASLLLTSMLYRNPTLYQLTSDTDLPCGVTAIVQLHLRTSEGALPGSLPADCDRLLMMGMKMPPALAVVEGMAGARNISAVDRPYARPRELLPKALTKRVATRSPSPVFWKPCQQHDSRADHQLLETVQKAFSDDVQSTMLKACSMRIVMRMSR